MIAIFVVLVDIRGLERDFWHAFSEKLILFGRRWEYASYIDVLWYYCVDVFFRQ